MVDFREESAFTRALRERVEGQAQKVIDKCQRVEQSMPKEDDIPIMESDLN